jgi:hypothetical protein
MLNQFEYNDLWTINLGLPLHNIPCYYQYLQREVYFQDYLDLFCCPTNGNPTYERINVNDHQTVSIQGLQADPNNAYTLIDGKGVVRLIVDYDFPFDRKELCKGRRIQCILIGEAAPSASIPDVNKKHDDSANSYFYNTRHILSTPYFTAPVKAFGIVGGNKTEKLLSLAREGFILLDLFPFSDTYNSETRKKINYTPFWDLLCSNICNYFQMNILSNGSYIAFSGPAAIHHRIVEDLKNKVIKLPICTNFNLLTSKNSLEEITKGVIPVHKNTSYITNWEKIPAGDYYINTPNYKCIPNSKDNFSTPIYNCECWDSSFQGPNAFFISIAFNLPLSNLNKKTI